MLRRRSHAWALAASLLAFVTPGHEAGAAPPADGGRGANVARLRVEVDELAQRLRAQRSDVRDELAALRAEKAELERRVRLAEVRRRTLQTLQRQADDADRDLAAEADAWVGPARAAVDLVRAHVERGLPFAVADRLAALDAIAAELERAEPDVGRSVQRLWRFIEQEAAMTGEVSLSRQPVRIEGRGEAQLADVLRLGMAVMYVRTADETFAWAVPAAGGWRLERIEDPELEGVVRESFEAHEHNRGYGPIDLAIPAGLLALAADGEEVARAD